VRRVPRVIPTRSGEASIPHHRTVLLRLLPARAQFKAHARHIRVFATRAPRVQGVVLRAVRLMRKMSVHA